MSAEFDVALAHAKQLQPADRVRLVECLLPEIEESLRKNPSMRSRDWMGIFGDVGPIPNEEDFAEMRRMAWPTR